jgi:uncharacterized protein (DUF1330 family)
MRGDLVAAYLIYSREEITDKEKSLRYGELVIPQIRQFGGEVLVARGNVHVLEGAWDPMAVTILRFETIEALMAWWNSPEYAPLKQMRLESNTGDIIVVEGGH